MARATGLRRPGGKDKVKAVGGSTYHGIPALIKLGRAGPAPCRGGGVAAVFKSEITVDSMEIIAEEKMHGKVFGKGLHWPERQYP